MTKTDESPEEATNPYWSDELLAVLAEALGDEDRARQTLEGIIQRGQRHLQGQNRSKQARTQQQQDTVGVSSGRGARATGARPLPRSTF